MWNLCMFNISRQLKLVFIANLWFSDGVYSRHVRSNLDNCDAKDGGEPDGFELGRGQGSPPRS